MKSPAGAVAPLAPVDRAVKVWLRVAPGPLFWGATWATACGGLAAWPWSGWGSVARLAVAWLAAATLLGAFWSPALGAAVEVPAAHDRAAGRGAASSTGAYLPRRLLRLTGLASPLQVQRGLALALALVVAAVLGWPVVAAVALGAVVAVVRPPGGDRGSVGFRRSLLEIAVPAAAGWLALVGSGTASTATVAGGAISLAARWLAPNAGFLGILTAFVVVHHGATAVRAPEDVGRRYHEIAAGYLLAVAVLALRDSPVAAGAVAMLFVLQWPHQALFRRGRARWHLQATQPMAMAAMAVAFAGVAVV